MTNKKEKVNIMCKVTIDHYNGVHMTAKEKFVYGFSLAALKEVSITKLMRKFRSERKLRQTNKDFLENDCQPIVDGDRQMILTGCDVTAHILQRLTGVKPKFVAYPVWPVSHRNLTFLKICFQKWGFSFCKKFKNYIIMVLNF